MSVAFHLISYLKKWGDCRPVQRTAATLLQHLANGNNLSEEVEEQVANLANATDKLSSSEALVKFCTEKGFAPAPMENAEEYSVSSLIKSARAGVKQGSFVDPSTQRFWFSNFGATAQDVSVAQFFEKFVSHFDDPAHAEQLAVCQEGLLMDRAVRRPLTNALVGNCDRLGKAHLQDFLDSSAEYCLPEAVFTLVTQLTANVPPMCPMLEKIIEGLQLDDAARDCQLIRDSGTVFLECSKLSSARTEQYFSKLGVSSKDATALALGVYMKHREAQSNEIEIPSKVEKAILDMGDKCIHIDLSNCGLSDPELKGNNVGESLTSGWDGVLTLDLSGNNLHAAGVAKVVEIMKHQQKLTKLTLRGNNIQASGIEKILTACVDHPALTWLDVSICHGGPQAAVVIGESIPRTKITHLCCNGNDFGPAGAACVASILKADVQHRLISLSMGSNHMGDAGALALAESLSQDEYLTTLLVEENDISDDGASNLMTAVKAHRSMKHVDLSYNWVSSAVVDTVAKIAQGSKTGLTVSLRGFAVQFQAALKKVNSSNTKKIQSVLRDLAHKPLAMWTCDEVLTWSHLALGRVDLGKQLKQLNIDGAKLRSYTMRDFHKDGLTDPELQKLIFSFHETLTMVQ